jgi:hypothetical protein
MPLKFSEAFPGLLTVQLNNPILSMYLQDSITYLNTGDIYGACYSLIAVDYMLWDNQSMILNAFIGLLNMLDSLEIQEGQTLSDVDIYEAWLRASLESVG